MHQFRITFAVLAAAALVGLVPALVKAQVDPNSLPEGWADLPSAEFVAVVRNQLSGAGQSSPDLEEAIASHAASLLVTTNVLETASQFAVPVSLYGFCSDRLTDIQKATLATRLAELAGPSNDPSTMSYLQLRSRLALMYLRSAPLTERSALIASWITADSANVDSIPVADLPFLAEQAGSPKLDSANFSVEWTGTVTPPQTGQYTFSVAPFNPNTEHNQYFIRETMSVSVGGRDVLRATPESWTTEGSPVQLTARSPVDLRVQVAFDCSAVPHYDLHASLRWEGPGTARSLVPSSALSPPDGEGNGLQAVYSASVDGKQYTETRVDPTIDGSWLYLKTLVPEHPSALAQMGARLWDQAMDQDYLARCEREGATADQHPLLYEARSSELLTSLQRAAFTREVLGRPNLLEPLPLKKMISFYAAYRTGSPDDALDVLGQWCQLHPDAEVYFPVRPSANAFYKTNRDQYRFLTVYVVWQHPHHMTRLQDQYLVLPDGGCCLPVAYTLAYGHLVQDRLADWVELLDAQLSNTQLAGNQRVGWLLARAQAEEIRRCRPERHAIGKERLLAGRGWIEEANLVAENEATKLRTLKELVVRMASLNDRRRAEKVIDRAKKKLSSPTAASACASWQTQMDRLAAERKTLKEANRALGRRAYLDTLKRRLQRAHDRSDSAAVARYETMIDAFANE